MQTARLWIDVGLTFEARVEIDYADEATAKLGRDLLAGTADFGAGALVMAMGYVRIRMALPGLREKDDLDILLEHVPVGLLARAEKGLRRGCVEVKGKTASLSFTVPLRPTDGKACQKLFAHEWSKKVDEDAVRPGLVFGSRPTTPQAVSEAQETNELPPPPPSSPPTDRDEEAKKLTLTVANVRKEDVVLFTYDRGELTPAGKVPHGEAIDLEARQGQRWVAVFMSEPYRETLTMSGDKAVWLLRTTVTPVPCHGTPAQSLKRVR